MALEFVSESDVKVGREPKADGRFSEIRNLIATEIPLDRPFVIAEVTKVSKKTGEEVKENEANNWRKALADLAKRGGTHPSGNGFDNLHFVGARRQSDNAPLLILRVGAPKKASRKASEVAE